MTTCNCGPTVYNSTTGEWGCEPPGPSDPGLMRSRADYARHVDGDCGLGSGGSGFGLGSGWNCYETCSSECNPEPPHQCVEHCVTICDPAARSSRGNIYSYVSGAPNPSMARTSRSVDGQTFQLDGAGNISIGGHWYKIKRQIVMKWETGRPTSDQLARRISQLGLADGTSVGLAGEQCHYVCEHSETCKCSICYEFCSSTPLLPGRNFLQDGWGIGIQSDVSTPCGECMGVGCTGCEGCLGGSVLSTTEGGDGHFLAGDVTWQMTPAQQLSFRSAPYPRMLTPQGVSGGAAPPRRLHLPRDVVGLSVAPDAYITLSVDQQAWVRSAFLNWLDDLNTLAWFNVNTGSCPGVQGKDMAAIDVHDSARCFQAWYAAQGSPYGRIAVSDGTIDSTTLAALIGTVNAAPWGAVVGSCPSNCIGSAPPTTATGIKTGWILLGLAAAVVAGGAYYYSRTRR